MRANRSTKAARLGRVRNGWGSGGRPLRFVGAIAAATAWQAPLGFASDITVSNTTPSPVTVSTPYQLTGVGNITFGTEPGDITYSGQITDAGVNGLIKAGPGMLVLTGGNQYNGTTQLNGGTVVLFDPDAIGSGPIAFGGGALFYGGAFSTDYSSRFAPVPAGVSAAIYVVGSNDVSFASTISGDGGLEKRGDGTLTLSAANAYAGTTTLAGGTLRLGNVNALAGGGALKFTGGELDLGGNSLRVSSLSGATGSIGNSAVPAGGTTLTFDGGGGSSSFGGSLKGNLSLGVSGGTLTLAGSNTFTGGTTLGGGTLVAGSAGALGSGPIVFSGGTLRYGNAVNTDVSSRIAPIASGASVQVDVGSGNSVTFASTLSGAGGLTKLGFGTLTLARANSYAGTTLLNLGVLQLQDGGALGTGAIGFNGGTLQYGDGVSVDLSGRFLPIPGGVSAIVDVGSSNVIFANPIEGSGGLMKRGSGVLTLATPNTFTGPISLDDGTLTGDGDAINANSSGQGIVFNGGALSVTGGVATAKPLVLSSTGSIYTNGFDCTFSGPLSGSGLLNVYGPGSLTLSGSGSGHLSTIDGGQVTVQGTLADNSFLVVGKDSQGTLLIPDGGSLGSVASPYGNTIIAQHAGSQGLVEVRGPGAQLITGGQGLYVGYDGSGTLRIADGARVEGFGSNHDHCFIAYGPGSAGEVVVDGTGTAWQVDTTEFYIGYGGLGSLTISNGGQVETSYSTDTDVGNGSGAGGTVIITGAGSKLVTRVRRGFSVVKGSITLADGGAAQTDVTTIGPYGRGVVRGAGSSWTTGMFNIWSGLTVSDGSLVSSTGCSVDGVGGSVSLDGAGTTWLAGSMHVGDTGTGTVSLRHGASISSTFCILGFDSGSTGRAVIQDGGTQWDTHGSKMSVGYYGAGRLELRGGGSLASGEAELGGARSGNGVVIVSDAGTVWSSGTFTVGYQGSGRLSILDGAHVSSQSARMAADDSFGSAKGVATVQGAGSAWTIGSYLLMPSRGSATVNVADHGTISTGALYVGQASSVNLHVSGDGMLVLGDASGAGILSNDGRINFLADMFLAPGTYRPIMDAVDRTMSWSGAGSYNGFGGTWDANAKTFSVPAATLTSAGGAVEPVSGSRLLVTDGGAPLLGVSFASVGGASMFSARRMRDDELSGLELSADESALAAWDFSTDLASSQVLLSFVIGPNATDLQVWQYADGTWNALAADDLVYYNGVASFSVSSFSGYAVTGVIPEPTALCMMALGGLALLGRVRSR